MSWPALPVATVPPAAWSARAKTTAPVSPPRAPAAAALVSTARPASTPVPPASTGPAARRRVSASTEPPAIPSAASVSAPPASTASSVRGGVNQAHLERAAISSVTVRQGHLATPSPASAFAPQGAQGPPVTLTADQASLGRAVPCAAAAGLGPAVTLSVGSAAAWTATQGPPASRWPLTDQRLGSAAGHRNTSTETALEQVHRPGALVTTEEGRPWPGLQPSPVSEGRVQPCSPGLCKDRLARGRRPWLARPQGARASGPAAPASSAEQAPPPRVRTEGRCGRRCSRGPLPSKQVLLVLGPGTAVVSLFPGAAAHCIYVRVFMGSWTRPLHPGHRKAARLLPHVL